MSSYLDELPNEILFHIISFLENKIEVNKFIYSIETIGIRFVPDIMWQKMFYQNITDPVILEDEYADKLMWREQYYINIEPTDKYFINQIDTRLIYDYVIITVGYRSAMKDLDRLINSSLIKLSFIADKNGKFLYINPDDKEFIQKIKRSDIVSLKTCMAFRNPDRNTISSSVSVAKRYLTTFRSYTESYVEFFIDNVKIIRIHLS